MYIEFDSDDWGMEAVRGTGLLIGSWSRGYVEKYVQKIASALYIHVHGVLQYRAMYCQTEILPAGFLPLPPTTSLRHPRFFKALLFSSSFIR